MIPSSGSQNCHVHSECTFWNTFLWMCKDYLFSNNKNRNWIIRATPREGTEKIFLMHSALDVKLISLASHSKQHMVGVLRLHLSSFKCQHKPTTQFYFCSTMLLQGPCGVTVVKWENLLTVVFIMSPILWHNSWFCCYCLFLCVCVCVLWGQQCDERKLSKTMWQFMRKLWNTFFFYIQPSTSALESFYFNVTCTLHIKPSL